jgi:transcriptional regulator with XRE-family HTH domain
MSDLDLASREARAKRLRYLRESLRLSMPKLGKLCDIPSSSVQNWEYARFGGLTESGAKKIIHGLKAKDFHVSLEWLLFGIGKAPSFPFSPQDKIKNTEDTFIREELQLFQHHYHDAIDCVIADDGMMPRYIPGDHVAGVRCYHESIQKTIGLPCIIETTSGNTLVRTIEIGDRPNVYNLICENENTSVPEPMIKNISINSVAPIIWIRRKKQIS